MSEEIPVHIYFLLDRSFSMKKIQSVVVSKFNEWLEKEQDRPGKCRFTLVQFDDVNAFEIVYDAIKLTDVPPLTTTTYVPRGNTPLLQAEGQLMLRAQARQQDRKTKGKKTEAVLVTTYTDGEENTSGSEWTYERVAALKKELEEQGFAFAYLGVGMDAYLHGQQASRVGTHVASSRSYAASAAGVGQSMDSYTVGVANVRSNAAKGMTTNSADLFVEEPPVEAEAASEG